MKRDKPICEGEVREVAVFTARNHFAEVRDDGNLVVYYRKPVKTIDKRISEAVSVIAELSRDPANHQRLLAEVNRKNAKFWEVKDATQVSR